jgi:hypothetical protein
VSELELAESSGPRRTRRSSACTWWTRRRSSRKTKGESRNWEFLDENPRMYKAHRNPRIDRHPKMFSLDLGFKEIEIQIGLEREDPNNDREISRKMGLKRDLMRDLKCCI